MKKETYISINVETDGPIPGSNSMLSLGAAAFVLGEPSRMVGTFSANFRVLPGATTDPDTTKFWEANATAYAATRVDPVSPWRGMAEFVAWVGGVSEGSSPVAVCYPATFDFMFVYWYLIQFGGKSPFGFSLDVKTLGMAIMGSSFKGSSKRNFPKHWFPKGRPHTHVALDDAIEQGEIFCNMMVEIGPLGHVERHLRKREEG